MAKPTGESGVIREHRSDQNVSQPVQSTKVQSSSPLRGVKDWVHMKTAKMMQDFNWLCNLDVNHKLLLIFIIKVVYLCTLYNKIISPAHFVYMLWWPTPTWFSNIKA